MSNLKAYKKANLIYDVKYYLSTNWRGYPKEIMIRIKDMMLGRNAPKKKFVIFSTGRSGSTLLLSLMNSNKEVFCDGELLKHRFFNPRAVIDAQARLYEDKIYGFKLMTHHIKDIQPALQKDGKAFLKQLLDDDYRIIYLERCHRLDQSLSMMYAILRNDWHKKSGKTSTSNNEKLTIDFDSLDWWMNGFQQLKEYESAILEGLPHLHLTYEGDLADNSKHPETVRRICDYLDIPQIKAITNLKKITPKKYESYIENVEALKEHLRNTPFAQYASLERARLERQKITPL